MQPNWKSAAFSFVKRENGLGCSIKTERFRYTEYVSYDPDTLLPIWRDEVIKARELYDHQKDPYEYINVAEDVANEALVKELSQKLHLGWKYSLPKVS